MASVSDYGIVFIGGQDGSLLPNNVKGVRADAYSPGWANSMQFKLMCFLTTDYSYYFSVEVNATTVYMYHYSNGVGNATQISRSPSTSLYEKYSLLGDFSSGKVEAFIDGVSVLSSTMDMGGFTEIARIRMHGKVGYGREVLWIDNVDFFI